jgi:hypothetical protein
MTQETPTEHSDLIGGSTAGRRINCPRSYHLEQLVPKSPGNEYAREGTALHEMIAVVLDQGKNPEDLLPFTHHQPPKGVEKAWEMTIDHDLWDELGQPALDMFDEFLDQLEAEQDAPAHFYIEKKFEFPGVPGGFGTSDVVFRCGKVGGIWDWKFGRGPVGAKKNPQLMFYFASARAGLPKFFEGIDEVRMCISQPKLDDAEPKVWSCPPNTITDFEKTVQDTIKTIQSTDKNTAPIKKGDHCRFADCKAVCPKHRGAAAALGERLSEMEEAKHVAAQSDPEDFDLDAYLADALEFAELAKDWADSVLKMAHDRIDHGFEVVGWKTVDKRSSGRVWTVADDVVKKRLQSRGLKAADYQKKSVVSVAQAEKALKKIGKELPEKLYEKKASSGTTLVREGDPRQPAGTPQQQAKALGSALAKHMKEDENDG